MKRPPGKVTNEQIIARFVFYLAHLSNMLYEAGQYVNRLNMRFTAIYKTGVLY